MLTLIKQSIKKIKASAFGLKYNLHWTNGDRRGEELYVQRKTLAKLRNNEHDAQDVLNIESNSLAMCTNIDPNTLL